MKGFCFLGLWPLFFSFLQAQADIIYDPWDWVTYRFSQDIASISDGPEHVYFASPGGILRYQTFGRYWDFPITTSQGLSDFTVTAIYYDFHTHMLWASTPQGLDYSMDGGGRWSKVSRDELGLRDREVIIRIGSTAEELFCVTPSQILKADHLSGFLIMSYSEPPPKDQITWGSSLMIGTAAVRDIVDGFTAMGGWNLELGWLNGPSLNEKAPITTVHTDRFGDMWVGTRGGPVFRGDQQLMILEPKPVGLAQTNATVLEFWGTSLWVAGVSAPDVPSGITLLDTDRSTSELFRRGVEISFGLDAVTAIEKVGKQWWFGTPDGIQIYDPQKDTWTVFSKVKTLIDETISHLKTDGEYIYVVQ
jgi:ligand-binding sensor domain-containing protein